MEALRYADNICSFLGSGDNYPIWQVLAISLIELIIRGEKRQSHFGRIIWLRRNRGSGGILPFM